MDASRVSPRSAGSGWLRGRSALCVLVLLAAASSGSAAARVRHPGHRGWTDGVVRCVATASRSARLAAHPAARHGALPTDRAVFFARSGDRCFWHRGALGRG